MRHIYIRNAAGFIWLAAAMVSIISGKCEMSVFYLILSGIFFYSAFAAWKKEKNKNENASADN